MLSNIVSGQAKLAENDICNFFFKLTARDSVLKTLWIKLYKMDQLQAKCWCCMKYVKGFAQWKESV